MRRAAGLLLPAALAACARPAPPRPVSPGALRVAVPYELNSLDPHARDKLGSFAILSNVYEPLVALDAEMGIEPCLATSWENPSASTWVFHLRRGVSFHDGRGFRAADVAYSFKRILRSDDLEMKTYLLDVEEAAVVDERTVRVRTRVGARNLLYKLSSVLIVPEGESGATLPRSPSGTGPYILEGATAGSVRLRRNDFHWGARPRFPEVSFDLGRSAAAAATGLRAGTYQLIQCDSRRLVEDLSRSPGYVARRHPSLYVKYLGYDLARRHTPFCSAAANPFRDPRVRRAIHIGIDRQRLVQGLASDALPATQPVPRFVVGFNPTLPEPRQDPERARALLRQAGYPDGFRVALHTRQVLAEAAHGVASQLAPLGIEAEVAALPDAEFYSLADRREASFFLNRFACPSGDASDLLDDVVHSLDRARHLGIRNFGGYADAGLDAAIERADALDRMEERSAALQRVLARVMDELVVIPLYNDQDVYVMDKEIAFEPRSDSVIRAAEVGTSN